MTATIEAKQDLVKTKFNDVVIGKDHIFLLSDRSIDIYQKESKNKTSTFVIPGSDSYKCNKFAIHETLNYLAVKCTADLSHQLLIINITKIDNIVAFKDIFDLDSYYVRKMLFKEDNLYILDGPEDPLSESSIIYVLHIALSETHPHELFELVDIINGEKVDEDFLYISDFDAVKAEGQLPGDQKLFFVDAKFGIRIIDIRPTESWYEEPSDPLGNQLNLSSIIAKDGNSREAIYYGVKVLSGKSINVNVSNYQVVFTTKNSQNYELFINVTIKSYEHVKCQSHIEKAFAVRSLYRYAGFTAAPVLEASVVVNKDKANIMDDGYLLMPYYFESENFMPGPLASQVVLLYDLQSYSNQILNESSYFYQYAIGGFRIPIKSFDYSFKLLSYKDKETKENIYEAILLNPYTSIAQVLSISRNLTLLFNATDLNSTKITFTAKNDYSQSSTTFPIDYFVEENSNDKT